MNIKLLLFNHNLTSPEARAFFHRLASNEIHYKILSCYSTTPDKQSLYITDDNEIALLLEQQNLPVIGYEDEHTTSLHCRNIVTDLWELDTDYLKERFAYLTSAPYCYYATERFSYWSLSQEETLRLYQIHRADAFYLPETMRTLTSEEVRTRYRYTRACAEMDPLQLPLGIRLQGDGACIGNLSLSTTPEYPTDCYNLEYYILPKARGRGYASLAIRDYLMSLNPQRPIHIYAMIRRENLASLRVMEKLGLCATVAPGKPNPDMIYYCLDALVI